MRSRKSGEVSRPRSDIGIRVLVALGSLALLLPAAGLSGQALGAVPGTQAAVTLAITIPPRVGVRWDRDVNFDLTTNLTPGTCLTFPPKPTTPYPCYWDDSNAAPVTINLFSNSSGASNTVVASIQGQAGNFSGSNASIVKVLYAANGTPTCPAGTVAGSCGSYTIMSSSAPTVFATAVAPTPGWSAGITKKFIFEVDNNLTPTSGFTAQTRTTTLTVTTP